jgi:hypothetical protein
MERRRPCWYCVVTLAVLTCALGRTAAADTGSPQLVRLIVEPQNVVLAGARATQRLLVSAQYEDGSIRDVTSLCEFRSSAPATAEVSVSGVTQARANGSATITAIHQGMEGKTAVSIQRFEDESYAFDHHVLPVLSRLGCNQMGCHGSPKGKSGFRLSLFGAEPRQDYEMITRSAMGRLLNHQDAEQSLLLLKAVGSVSHGGSQRTWVGSPEYRALVDWIRQGAPRGGDNSPTLTRLEVFPRARTLGQKAVQPLLVEAYYSDGSMADVTSLATITSSDDLIAAVDSAALAQVNGSGEAIVMASFGGLMSVSRLAIPQDLSVPYPANSLSLPAGAKGNPIDELVLARLRRLNIVPSELTGDTEFLRRAYLDVLGILPTPDEVRTFLRDERPDKRARFIDSLLDRPEFTDMWTLKWADLLRINRAFPINLGEKGMLAYHAWVNDAIAKNKPMNEFVREILTAQGSGFEVGPANFYRVTKEPQAMAEQAATVFLGIRLDCAHCHNHPFEQITWDDNYGLAAFFAPVKLKRTSTKDEEVVSLSDKAVIRHVGTGQVVQPKFLGGDVLKWDGLENRPTGKMAGDPRVKLADWITAPENPWFARNMANRVWFWLLGRGIVHEPDDFRSTNPPSNPELLDYLADEFVRSGYNMKHIFRLVLHSRTYQLSSRPNRWNEHDQVHFSHYRIKRLAAEQLLDAMAQATGVPEKYGNMPLGTRAAQLPDGNVRSFFLDVFGRPKRALACECERSGETHVGQSLLLINSDALEAKLTAPSGRVAKLAASTRSNGDIVEEFYLATLNRFPTAQEKEAALAVLGNGPRQQRLQDLMWALLNTKEFLFNH